MAAGLLQGFDSATLNSEGIRLLKEQRFAQAARRFELALGERPGSSVLRVNLALARYYEGDFQKALDELQQVTQKDSRDPYAHFLLGVLEERQGSDESARGHFEQVIALDPSDAGTMTRLGLIALRRGQDEIATRYLETALRSDPEDSSALFNLGRLMIRLGQAEKGHALLERFSEQRKQQRSMAPGGMGSASPLRGKYGQPRELLNTNEQPGGGQSGRKPTAAQLGRSARTDSTTRLTIFSSISGLNRAGSP